jgi:NADH:ubiquinone oxidoreductase subunit C
MKNNLSRILTIYRDYLKKIFPQLIGYVINGDLFIKIPSNKIINFLSFLKKHTLGQYEVLSDICALDYPWKKKRFEIIYNLLSTSYNTRLTLILSTEEAKFLETIKYIYKNADWLEREIWDLFGIFFINHKDLRRILTDYGFKGHPLRKDFPLTGFIEVRYYNIEKRILVEETSLSQKYRSYFFNNNWIQYS